MSKSKLIRIGNDIVVRWTVKTNGADASLDDKDIAVRLTDVLGGNCNITWSVDGNVVTVSYPGKFQKKLGHYTLVLIDTTGGGMKTVDVCKAFELVPYSFLAGGSDASNIETEVVELTSSIEYGTFVEIDDTLTVKGMAADAKKTGEELAKKVEKVTGKGLSTNDYTDAEKQKLSSALTEHQDITGKADVFCINLTTSGIDKTYAQIKEAVAAGKVIIGDYYGKGKVQFLPSLTKTEQDQAIVFAYARSGGRMIGTIIIRANGRAEIYDGGVDITDRTTPSGIDVGSYLPWSDRYVYGNAQTGMYACSSLLVNTDYGKKYILWYEFDGVCPKKVFSYDIRSWGAHWPEQIDSNVVLYCDEVYESSDAANWPTWLKRIFNIDSRSKIDEYEQRITAIESVEIVDNLTTDDADKPLSAKQGKVLNEKILKIVDLEKYKDGSTIVEDLNKSCVYTVNFGNATQMLSDSSKSSHLGIFVSFNNGDYYCFISNNTSGYYISSWVDTTVEKIYQADFVTEAEWDYSEAEELIRMYYPWRLSNSSVEVVDNLTTDDSAKALSAKQGKVLSNMISQHSSVEVVDNLTTDDAGAALSAKQGKVLKELADAKQPALNDVQTSAVNSGVTSSKLQDIENKVKNIIADISPESAFIGINANGSGFNLTDGNDTHMVELSSSTAQKSALLSLDGIAGNANVKASTFTFNDNAVATQAWANNAFAAKSALSEKQDALTTEQLAAVNSGVTSDVVANMSNIAKDLGQISDLQTTEKTSAVAAINELHNNIGDVETILSTING